ncbi:aryl-alcohol dehydrogenase-like predicted oxidoreductase [Naumannella cuiyingiana]|uniref:Aryl-alcohol dehydrogenase-like predicted oxidoreductase n=1 Tax=Naumannella cuiyingiana TaxID=1347891 RepID=A0A7Z0IMB9_9ACTN|nr:aldo/keto reductase [Naumannella cuiyingiana]NYI72574.1 aryl-alcohol dehydrogenase-like predicted oxidoreductase [Naumannella cuiyingiana]
MTAIDDATQPVDEFFRIGGDLRVRRIGLGAMRLTDATGDGTQAGAQIWRPPADPADAITLLRRAVELGVQLIDTADAYALGENEELIAKALHPYPEDVSIATKVGLTRPSPTEWVLVGNPAYLRQQVELSLRRLRVERIDLLQLHRLDPAYPVAEQVGALDELRIAGKIRHLGLSEVSVPELDEARTTAPIASVQNAYNLSARTSDPVIDHAADLGIAFLPYFPLAIGDLARAGSVLDQIARELGATGSQVALAWLLHRAPNVLPIPGTTSIRHLEENLGAAEVQLTAEQVRRIEEASGGRDPGEDH